MITFDPILINPFTWAREQVILCEIVVMDNDRRYRVKITHEGDYNTKCDN